MNHITAASMQAYLEVAVKRGLAKVVPVPNTDLSVLKYTRKAFYDGTWDSHLEECRGAVVTPDFEPVILPFRKIYNYGIERRAPAIGDHEIVTAMRKVNGFMMAATPVDGRIVVSTTGSLTSDFVQYGHDLIGDSNWIEVMEPGHTYLFEACHPKDPHIIPEGEGLYYLGRRKTEWGSPLDFDTTWASKLGVYRVTAVEKEFAGVKSAALNCQHEGYVVYTRDGRATKIKSPYYLAAKLFGRGNVDKLLGGRARQYLPEEYYPLIDHVTLHRSEFESLDEQQRLAFCREFLDQMCAQR